MVEHKPVEAPKAAGNQATAPPQAQKPSHPQNESPPREPEQTPRTGRVHVIGPGEVMIDGRSG